MKFSPSTHHRQSIRKPNHDYSRPGVYFITVCCYQRQALLGRIMEGRTILNETGHNVQQCWQAIPTHFPMAKLDEFVIMPNHLHGIIIIEPAGHVGANNHSPHELPVDICGTSRTIGSIIRGFKTGVMQLSRQCGQSKVIWQRNYWDRIVCNERQLHAVRQYIRDNPLKWQHDELFIGGK